MFRLGPRISCFLRILRAATPAPTRPDLLHLRFQRQNAVFSRRSVSHPAHPLAACPPAPSVFVFAPAPSSRHRGHGATRHRARSQPCVELPSFPIALRAELKPRALPAFASQCSLYSVIAPDRSPNCSPSARGEAPSVLLGFPRRKAYGVCAEKQ